MQAARELRNDDFKTMQRTVKKYPLFVNSFFIKRANSFIQTVVKEAMGIEHYWGRVEFAPGQGQIHLHIIVLAKDRAYLDDF